MNKTPQPMRGAASLVCALLLASAALAHGDEDHSAPTATVASTLLPRIGVTTDEFELVAVLEPGRLLIHVDRADSNQPVRQAQLEVEGAGVTTHATELAPGVFALSLARPLAAGSYALTFTVQTPDSGDLIAATLAVPPTIAAYSKLAQPVTLATQPWLWLAGGAGVALAGMSWALLRRRSAAGTTPDLGHAK